MGKHTVVRPCGKLEQYSTARHALGLYRCVSVACQYEAVRPLDRQAWERWIRTAVSAVVEREPFLRVGIVDEDSSRACFVHVPEVDLREQVVWHSAPSTGDEEYLSMLAKVLESGHDALWADTEARPPWRVTVVDGSDGGSRPSSRLDIVYSWHHAVGDGLSGKIFHESLLSALRDHGIPSDDDQPIASPLLHFQEAPTLPPPQEDAVKFTLSLRFVLKTLWEQLRPAFLAGKAEPAWSGGPVNIHGPYKTNLRLLLVDGATRDGLLAVCRSHGTTLTALVHVLTLLSLARQLPSEKVFESQTPMSLRPYVSAPGFDPSTSMSVLVASYTHHFSPQQVGELRGPFPEGTTSLEEKVWELAAGVKADLRRKAKELPADDVMGLLRWGPDWHEMFRGMDGKTVGTTFEVSNVGTIAGDDDGPGDVKVSRMVFSQSAGVGAAFNTNVAGCLKGSGGVAITWTWRDGIVEEGLMEGVKRDLGTWMGNLARSGRLEA